jgi:UDP-N-acetylmuramoyl-tripeptide--D-alanyl-D-alanine ligase
VRRTVPQVASALGVAQPVPSVTITGWSIDSRTLVAGDLFFALRGPNHDGHRYIGDVIGRGAAAAVVDHVPAGADPSWPLLLVNDTERALEKLGRYARAELQADVIGLTGSAGKTTSKEVIATLLAVAKKTGKNGGNLNNHLGVPLSLLRLEEDVDVAVLEMGMNHAGEIAHLASVAKPRVGVVTNVGYAHIENFESMDGVAAAKKELIDALPEDGVAVLNADDARVSRFGEGFAGRVVTFGMRADADVRADEVRYSEQGASFRVNGVAMESGLPGRHGVLNVLCGIAVAGLYGIAPGDLREAIRGLEPGPMRGRRFTENGILHWNDCYNSNPDAARAMVDLLADTPARRRIAVLGEMLELGSWSESLHRELGAYVARCGIDVLVGIRGAAKHAVDGALEADIPNSAAYFFATPNEAGEWLKGQAQSGDAILWKGSRGTRVEQALERFLG